MTSKQLGVWGFVLAVLSAVGAVVLVLTSTSVQYGKLLSAVEQTQKDVAEIKATIATLAPPTIKHASPAGPTAGGPAVAANASPRPPVEHQAAEPNDAEPLPDWHRAFIADKCRLCPTCCATAATGEP